MASKKDNARHQPIDLGNGTSTVLLTTGKVALIDTEDAPKVAGRSWFAHPDGYARVLLGIDDPKIQVDHINGDRLDNRKANLRVCSNAENGRNRGKQLNNTSGYKGVSWHKASGKWGASIRLHGKAKHLGLFVEKENAARAYDVAAKELFGEFAVLNFPGEL